MHLSFKPCALGRVAVIFAGSMRGSNVTDGSRSAGYSGFVNCSWRSGSDVCCLMPMLHGPVHCWETSSRVMDKDSGISIVRLWVNGVVSELYSGSIWVGSYNCNASARDTFATVISALV